MTSTISGTGSSKDKRISADYLVVGAGGMGMAFVDTLLTESDATVVVVDRLHQPGGHWNYAYPFVRLHGPSSFYGVNSRALGSDSIDVLGWNKGLYELATAGEVCAYFDQVMQQRILPTGRVRYFPMSDHLGDGRIVSRVSGAECEVDAGKTVDATYMDVVVPSMRKPSFSVAAGVHCEPVNYLVRVSGQFERFVIIGAGKTGMDACLFLLKNGVDPDRIGWVMPRDSWMLDRANLQAADLFSQGIGRTYILQIEAAAQSQSYEDLFHRVQAAGQLIRFDEDVWPTMFRCATVTQAEYEQLKRINDIIRCGRVTAIEPNEIVLELGAVATSSNTLHVDCTADGLKRREVLPVFADGAITLQTVRACQQVFSGAFTAYVESNYAQEATKNELCTVVPHPDSDADYPRILLSDTLNFARWSKDEQLNDWLEISRVDGFTQPGWLERLRAQEREALEATTATAVEKLSAYLAGHER